MSKLRLVADRRIATKLALSFSVVLAITGSVGFTGYHFLGVLQNRMATTADVTSVKSALQGIVTDAARFRATGDIAAAKAVTGSIAAEEAGLAARGEVSSTTGADALSSAGQHLSAAVEQRSARLGAEERLTVALRDLETRGLALSDKVTGMVKEATLADTRASDAAKAATRLLAGLTEIRTAAVAVSGRFADAANPEADKAVVEGLGLQKSLRKLNAVLPKDGPVDGKQFAAQVSGMTTAAQAAIDGTGARFAAAEAADAVLASVATLTDLGIAGLSEAGNAQVDAAPARIAAAAAEAGAVKLVSAVRKLGVDFATFRVDPRKATLDSFVAQTAQVDQIAQILSVDGKGHPEIEGLHAALKPVLDGMLADARTVREADGLFIAHMSDVGTRLAAADAAVSAIVAGEAEAAAVDAELAQNGILLAMATAALAALGIGMALAMAIRTPIVALTGAMERLAGGDTAIDLGSAERQDEIGAMSRAVLVFRDNAVERARLEAASAAEDAARTARNRRIEALIAAFQAKATSLLDEVGRSGGTLRQTADELDAIADQTATRAGSAMDATLRASENVQTVAASAEELAASIEEISQQVERTKGIVDSAVGRAREANQSMSGLSEMAGRIGSVIALIKAVADQTNLLALNATIEAARAGEAGKGFAVVAAEVKGLARQTADATEEIGRQIAAIQDATGLSVDRIAAIARTMEEIDAHTAGIAAAVQEQGAATSEISANITHVAGSTMTVNDNMKVLNASVAKTTDMSGSVLTASTGMSRTADDLRGAIEDFLRDVAAA